jgi:hypothetical protein
MIVELFPWSEHVHGLIALGAAVASYQARQIRRSARHAGIAAIDRRNRRFDPDLAV